MGHYSKDCPKPKSGNGGSKVIALNANLAQAECNRLIFLKGKIIKQDVLCLLDIGAFHNFITRENAERMELQLEELKALIKVHFADGDGTCDEAFETLKGILVKAPVLKLPDFDKDFEIHSNAPDFAIGRVLVQDGRPVAIESKKLNETERRWPTHENEMWAVIHCLKTWGHYIGSKDVVVWTHNVTLKYFTTQPKLSSKQVRWQDTFALFNVDI